MAKKIKIKVKKPHGLKDFDIAMQHYESGDLQQAEAVCRKITQSETDHTDVWRLLGMIAARYNDEGIASVSHGKIDTAIKNFGKAVEINPDFAEAYNNLGNALADRFAAKKIEMAVISRPDDPDLNEAIGHYKKAIELKHDFAAAYSNLGNAFSEKGLIEESIECYKKALSITPFDAEIYNNLGTGFSEKGLPNAAMESFKKALNLNPEFAEAYNNLGTACFEKGMVDEAIENYRKALSLRPDYAEAYNNLGGALRDKGMLDEAIENYEKALSLNARTYNNLGNAYAEKGILSEAIKNYQKALSLNSDDPNTRKNLGMTYLLAKNFDQGWQGYEWRLKESDAILLSKPGWNGSSLENRTILVYAEQGYGDTLQFARYLPELYEDYGAEKVLFISHKGLEQLFRESDLKADILDAKTPVESLEFDTNIHLLSLPLIFKTNLENMPFKQKRYLKANPEKVKWYRDKFFNLQPATCNLQLKVGIFWQGNPKVKHDGKRSMPLRNFYPLCRLSGVKVYSLQKGYGIEQLNDLPEDIEIVNLGETFNDFSDTAAAIENLDLIITIDTAVAHLSGASGKKTLILLPSFPEWRWHLDLDYSPWYEDVKLLRHKEPGRKDWEEMMERVVEEIRAQGVERKGRGNSG